MLENILLANFRYLPVIQSRYGATSWTLQEVDFTLVFVTELLLMVFTVLVTMIYCVMLLMNLVVLRSILCSWVTLITDSCAGAPRAGVHSTGAQRDHLRVARGPTPGESGIYLL